MIAQLDPIAGRAPAKPLRLTSVEDLEHTVARVVQLKLEWTERKAAMEQEVMAVQQRHSAGQQELAGAISELEERVFAYCEAHREELFTEKKSRVIAGGHAFGFELTPPRVATQSKKITFRDVLQRLLRVSWGSAYVRPGEPKLDKDALLADRDRLTTEQLTAAGLRFEQDEQFFIRPKSEVAFASVKER